MDIRYLRFCKIDEKNINDAYEIYSTNKEYFNLCGTNNVTIQSIYEDMSSFPEDIDKEQKVFEIIYYKNEPIAVLDLILSFPFNDTFYIGLLLIHGDKHRSSYGRNIYNIIENKMKDLGYKKGRLGVLSNNSKGQVFWEKMGFTTIKTLNSTSKPENSWIVNIMEKELE